MPTLSGFSAFSFVLLGKIIYFFVNMQVFSKKTKFSSFFCIFTIFVVPLSEFWN